MSDQDPNSLDPNTSQQQSSDSQSDMIEQTQIANQLNLVLQQVNDRLESINNLTQSQSSLTMNIVSSFETIQQHSASIYESSSLMSSSIEAMSNSTMNSFSQSGFERINRGLELVSETANNGITSHARNLNSMQDNVEATADASTSMSQAVSEGSESLRNTTGEASSSMENFQANSAQLEQSTRSFTEALIELKDKLKSLFSSFTEKLTSISGGILKFGKMIVSGITTLVGAAAKFVKFALTVPFTITQAAVELGNKIRTDLVETIQSAAEDLKESFDFSSDIGKGVQEMTARGKGMLLAFQNPSSELVKLFGYGATGIANMIKEVGTNIAAMGHFSELFGRSIMGNARRTKDFTKMVKAFGLSSEDIHYLALDASNNLEHINTRMAKMGVTLTNVSTEFRLDRKRLSKNFMILRKDITQFGHLSDEEIAKTTARLTQMRVKLEDAAAVFKKFSTFEDAANSVAILSQTFGMNLDAFDIIQAKNPEEIINMFRNSMLETGRSFQDLNRFEKDLMAQHTGMSAESLAALMNYRDLGLTHEEAVRRMQSERPEAKQMAALKKLNSAIKEVQKVLTFDSPFQAFADGLMANTTLSGDLKDTLVSLSGGYQSIFEYAKNLDGKTWTGLARPIKLIIDIMRGIFQSDAFKKGLVTTVSTIANFVADMFGVSNPDRVLSELEKKIKTASSKGGSLEAKKGNEKFRETVLTTLADISDSNLDAFGGLTGINREAFEGLKDPLDILPLLRKMQEEAGKNEALSPYFTSIIDNLKKRLKSINFNDGTYTPEQRDSVFLLIKSLDKVGEANKENLGKLATLSTRIMGAVIKGAAVAMTAILKVVNKGIDTAEAELKAEGKDINLIEQFFHFEKGELENLGLELNKAIREFFSKSSGMTSLTGWLFDGLTDIFTDVLNYFGGVLAIGLDEIFGTTFSKNRKMSLKKASFAPKRKPVDSLIGDAQSAMSAADPMLEGAIGYNYRQSTLQNDTVAELLMSLKDRIDTIEDPSAKKSLTSSYNRLTNTFLNDKVEGKELADLTVAVTSMLSGIQEGRFLGDVSKAGSLAKKRQYNQYDTKHKIRDSMTQSVLNEFNSLMSEKTFGKGKKLQNNFNNLQFASFWDLFYKDIIEDLKNTKKNYQENFKNMFIPQEYLMQSKYVQHPYFEKFLNYFDVPNEYINDKLNEITQVDLGLYDGFSPPYAYSNDSSVETVKDGWWLNKLSGITDHMQVLSYLMDSVAVPFAADTDLETQETSLIAENQYASFNSSDYSQNSGLSKEKAVEYYEKLCAIKEEVLDKKYEINSNVTFDKQDINKLMVALAQNNFVRELAKPQNTNGGFYILESAIGSRCFNPGSDGTAASALET